VTHDVPLGTTQTVNRAILVSLAAGGPPRRVWRQFWRSEYCRGGRHKAASVRSSRGTNGAYRALAMVLPRTTRVARAFNGSHVVVTGFSTQRRSRSAMGAVGARAAGRSGERSLESTPTVSVRAGREGVRAICVTNGASISQLATMPDQLVAGRAWR